MNEGEFKKHILSRRKEFQEISDEASLVEVLNDVIKEAKKDFPKFEGGVISPFAFYAGKIDVWFMKWLGDSE